MFNIFGNAHAINEQEHLAHHANDAANATSTSSMMGGGNMFSMMGYGMGGTWGWSMMIFSWIIGVLILVLLILLIIWLIKQIQK